MPTSSRLAFPNDKRVKPLLKPLVSIQPYVNTVGTGVPDRPLLNVYTSHSVRLNHLIYKLIMFFPCRSANSLNFAAPEASCSVT